MITMPIYLFVILMILTAFAGATSLMAFFVYLGFKSDTEEAEQETREFSRKKYEDHRDAIMEITKYHQPTSE